MPHSFKTLNRVLTPLLALIVLIAGAAAAGEKSPALFKGKALRDPYAGVAARVNGVDIQGKDVARMAKGILTRNQMGEDVPKELMDRVNAAALDQLVSAELLYQEGSKQEIKDLDKRAEEALTDWKGRFPTPEDYAKELKTANVTEKELLDLSRREIVIGNLLEKEVADKVTVTEDETKRFYTENLSRFKKEENVKASHILISADEKATPAEKKAAKEKAEAIRKRILAGEDFAALAKAESGCPSSQQGGDLGEFGKGQMVPEFEKAAFGLKVGEISNVVETQYGYHIIKLTERKNAETAPFSEVKDKLAEYLKGEKTQKSVADYVDGLKKKGKVELTK